MAEILVSGASSLIGRYLLPQLLAAGHTVEAISRTPKASHENQRWHQLQLTAQALDALPLANGYIYVHLAPLWLLPDLLPQLAEKKVARIIAFSSTSVLSKVDSDNAGERAVVARLAAAEQALCDSGMNNWTILRPTLIYGAGLDKNVSMIAKLIRRAGVFPIIGEGCGLRQPVHAQDLAHAVLGVLASPQTRQRVYALSGGETLSYRQMVARIFVALDKPCRIITVPPVLFAAALTIARVLPRFRHLHMQMAYRMTHDLCFDHRDAQTDFGYAPRKFDRPLE